MPRLLSNVTIPSGFLSPPAFSRSPSSSNGTLPWEEPPEVLEYSLETLKSNIPEFPASSTNSNGPFNFSPSLPSTTSSTSTSASGSPYPSSSDNSPECSSDGSGHSRRSYSEPHTPSSEKPESGKKGGSAPGDGNRLSGVKNWFGSSGKTKLKDLTAPSKPSPPSSATRLRKVPSPSQGNVIGLGLDLKKASTPPYPGISSSSNLLSVPSSTDIDSIGAVKKERRKSLNSFFGKKSSPQPASTIPLPSTLEADMKRVADDYSVVGSAHNRRRNENGEAISSEEAHANLRRMIKSSTLTLIPTSTTLPSGSSFGSSSNNLSSNDESSILDYSSTRRKQYQQPFIIKTMLVDMTRVKLSKALSASPHPLIPNGMPIKFPKSQNLSKDVDSVSRDLRLEIGLKRVLAELENGSTDSLKNLKFSNLLTKSSSFPSAATFQPLRPGTGLLEWLNRAPFECRVVSFLAGQEDPEELSTSHGSSIAELEFSKGIEAMGREIDGSNQMTINKENRSSNSQQSLRARKGMGNLPKISVALDRLDVGDGIAISPARSGSGIDGSPIALSISPVEAVFDIPLPATPTVFSPITEKVQQVSPRPALAKSALRSPRTVSAPKIETVRNLNVNSNVPILRPALSKRAISTGDLDWDSNPRVMNLNKSNRPRWPEDGSDEEEVPLSLLREKRSSLYDRVSSSENSADSMSPPRARVSSTGGGGVRFSIETNDRYTERDVAERIRREEEKRAAEKRKEEVVAARERRESARAWKGPGKTASEGGEVIRDRRGMLSEVLGESSQSQCAVSTTRTRPTSIISTSPRPPSTIYPTPPSSRPTSSNSSPINSRPPSVHTLPKQTSGRYSIASPSTTSQRELWGFTHDQGSQQPRRGQRSSAIYPSYPYNSQPALGYGQQFPFPAYGQLFQSVPQSLPPVHQYTSPYPMASPPTFYGQYPVGSSPLPGVSHPRRSVSAANLPASTSYW